MRQARILAGRPSRSSYFRIQVVRAAKVHGEGRLTLLPSLSATCGGELPASCV
jgi:hypothetical protein